MTHQHPQPVPDLILEQYRLHELGPAEAQRLERMLGADEALRRRLEAFQSSDEEIRRLYPAAWFAERVRTRQAADRRRFRGPSWHGAARWAVPAALTVITTVLVATIPSRSESPAVSGAITVDTGGVPDRIKGLRPALSVYRRTAEGTESLADGDVARTGDLLRIGYLAAGRSYGVILSIDGRGAVTLHLPATGGRAAALGRTGTVLLDRAYELDDAPRWERFYFITSTTPFDVASIIDTARRAAAGDRPLPAALSLTRGLEQVTLTLQKDVKP